MELYRRSRCILRALTKPNRGGLEETAETPTNPEDDIVYARTHNFFLGVYTVLK